MSVWADVANEGLGALGPPAGSIANSCVTSDRSIKLSVFQCYTKKKGDTNLYWRALQK